MYAPLLIKEKIFIVISHKNSLKKGSQTEWEVAEFVEFVNQLRNRHYSSSSAIGDYINRKMITGTRFGITEYENLKIMFVPNIKNKWMNLILPMILFVNIKKIPKYLLINLEM